MDNNVEDHITIKRQLFDEQGNFSLDEPDIVEISDEVKYVSYIFKGF